MRADSTDVRIAVRRFAPGEQATALRTADFVLVHGSAFYDRLIRFGQSLRYRGPSRQFAYWSHAAFVADGDGNLIEALAGGVVRSHISKYRDADYQVVSLDPVSHEDRSEALAFAQYCATSHDHYDWLTITSIALSFLTGSKLSFGVDGEQICSGLVARSLERTGQIFDEDPSHVPPAGLAEHFDVHTGLAEQGRSVEFGVTVDRSSES